MNTRSGASETTAGAGQGVWTDPSNSCSYYESGVAATTWLKKAFFQETNECGQILPLAEVIVKIEVEKRSLGQNMAHDKTEAGGGTCNSGGH